MAGKKKTVDAGPKMLSNLGRGDFVVLKRHLNKKGEISKKARLGSVRKTGADGHEVMWNNKSDKKQSMSRKTHQTDALHPIDGRTARKVSQYLHKHIATKSQPVETPPVVDAPVTPIPTEIG